MSNLIASPCIKDKKIVWLDLEASGAPGFRFRLDRAACLELQDMFNQLFDAEAAGTLALLCPPRETDQ